ncbi:MAG: hypothetical protein LBC40_04035 [Dysgonamonadaceae bacterium]|jgi:hypothetical protein|nr:hypothetical protein [Dysgonamonadaceae bacterium]
MALSIYSQTGTLKVTVSPEDGSTAQKGIMDDNVLPLVFKHFDCIAIDVNDYVDFLGERYWALERYAPNQKSTVEWEYNCKFYGLESLIKRILILKVAGNENEPVFSLTAPAIEHVRLFVDNINRAMSTAAWKTGEVIASPNITVDYSGTFINKGLDEVAGLAKTEWWIEGTTVNLSRCEHSAAITLGYRNGLLSLSKDSNENTRFFTRLFPIGSNRNIDRTTYGYNRLQLPDRQKYVEQNTQYGVIEHFEEAAFADIYPRRTGTVGTIRSEERIGENGEPFTIYYFVDPELNFNPNDYELPGLVKNVVFQSGELNGRDFEVNYNSDTQEFEIITQFPYDDNTQLPGGALVPKSGDEYILYNIRMPNEYYPIAEAEFEQAVQDYMDKHKLDKSVYKAPTDYIDLDIRNINLTLGQTVRLESAEFFPSTGYRLSRITRITRKVNNPLQADIEISDMTDRGKMAALEGSIDQTNRYVKTAMGGLPDIIRSWETSLPTDTNLFSARRSLKEFLSKKVNDSAEGEITFLKGARFGNYDPGEDGAMIDRFGNSEFLTTVIRSMLRSSVFIDGLTGEGFALWQDGNTGFANLTLDKLTVRQTLSVMELLINKVRSVGGQIIVSAANGKIKSVAQSGNNYVITFENENTFVVHDLVRCSTFTGNELKSYWVEVASISGNSIIVPVSEFAGQVPAAGDECVLMGNTANTLRQNLISIAATEDGQPRVDVLDGVRTKNFNGCLRTRLGNLDGINDSWFPAENQPHGNGLYADNAYLRGTFLLVTGEDVLTKFQITEGLVESAVEAVRQDFVEDRGYLNNPTFIEGMNKWETGNEAVFFLAGNKWIWLNDTVYSKKGDFASVRKDNGRTVVFIKNKYIRQANANLRNIPAFETNADGLKEPQAVYLSFFYRCQKAGTLTATFEGVNKAGFVPFDSIAISKTIDTTSGYQQFSGGGLWNGTGDFQLSFTGEIYLYMLILTVDRVEALAYKYQTLFEQSEKLVKIAAISFDTDGNPLQSSQIVTKADMNLIASGMYDGDGNLVEGAGLITKSNMTGMFVVGSDGTLKSLIGASAEGVFIKASNIKLEGLVTANQNFKILTDGSIEASNATITGTVNATDGEFNGKISLGSEKILLNKDGSGKLAGGNIAWGTDGYTTIGNMIIKTNGDIVVNNGTFKGAVNAIGGIMMGVRVVTSNATATVTDSFFLIRGASTVKITLPEVPNQGQMITIKNISDNAATIESSYNIYSGFEAEPSIILPRGRSYMLVFSGYTYGWSVVAQYTF